AATGEAITQAAQDGAANGDGSGQEAGSSNGFWIMLALLFGFMWFFVIRPENKRQRKRKEFQTALKKGDDVVTAGGLHGTIAAMDEQTITLKVSDNVRMKFDRVAVSRNASAVAEAETAVKK
ncbi:MAG: preprotein translocase subunit YajC, partial [Planctomycetota bacterium]